MTDGTIDLIVNGSQARVRVGPCTTLLEVLREQLGLTGAKLGCGTGQCGACTVQLDGRPAAACLQWAALVDGSEVSTVEGLPTDHGLPAALAAHGAVQCGFCTPGIVMAAVSALRDVPRPTEDDVRAALVGNLCRCTGYVTVVEAVLAWARSR